MAKDLYFNPSSSVISSYIHINANRYEIDSSMIQFHQSVGMTNVDPFLFSKLDLLNQKLNQFLFGGQCQVLCFTYPTLQEMYPPYSSPAHYVSDCLLVAQYPEFKCKQPKIDPFSNTYNPGWRDHSNCSWRPQPQSPQNYYQSQPFRAPYPNQNANLENNRQHLQYSRTYLSRTKCHKP